MGLHQHKIDILFNKWETNQLSDLSRYSLRILKVELELKLSRVINILISYRILDVITLLHFEKAEYHTSSQVCFEEVI
ncbi:hypothetical protein GDO86_000573 [Hymenochirus boettgeri]|uniref:Uncharacterized protein n=1 Tax=Hymenochirus boettgeri TaxID=247094 RepID=A0A8T2KBH3_9PIPI|nr:hypothetical protein GDO86_000573 [Hymenochirus boettgeri]